jgi:hypothetical protein
MEPGSPPWYECLHFLFYSFWTGRLSRTPLKPHQMETLRIVSEESTRRPWLSWHLKVLPFLRAGYRDWKYDIKHARWMRRLAWLFLSCWITGMIMLLVFLPFMDGSENVPCQPDNSFDVYSDYKRWKPSNVFEVTLGFGMLSFDQAKVIDVTWDVVRRSHCGNPSYGHDLILPSSLEEAAKPSSPGFHIASSPNTSLPRWPWVLYRSPCTRSYS